MKGTITLKGIIFDLDGTLANTLPVCFTAFRQAFFEYLNRHFTDEEISSYFGPSEEGIFQRLVQSEWQACLQMYLDEYEKAHAICEQPFPGIETALSYCQQKNIALGIVTGKGRDSAAISLRYLGLEDYFDTIKTGSANGGIKPLAIKSVLEKWKIAPECVAYVGDSPSDMVDAKEVGVIPLAAAWAKTASFERLEAMAPLATFSTVENFIDWIRLHGQIQ
ncbi:HAD family hydrolase [Brasilonema sp. UFV-L1]|uniref:HAD family hydrolase n=1 Tax=Brasilonema sp. UFV-L1 TaxID=2234130 RepID=UPI00145D4018|nr:HAD family hydrolase [Brasilonema sp. UFV-L1]NMG05434.1 haloacid dehalogenase [Brasilonema sp. UFV-L1]